LPVSAEPVAHAAGTRPGNTRALPHQHRKFLLSDWRGAHGAGKLSRGLTFVAGDAAGRTAAWHFQGAGLPGRGGSSPAASRASRTTVWGGVSPAPGEQLLPRGGE